jgi:hypothetical protein
MSEVLFAYWEGFTTTGSAPNAPPPLGQTPGCVDIVALAFAVPAPGSTISTDFLTSKNSKISILADAAKLRARGQKIIISINGNPAMPWSDLDPDTFAQSVKRLAREWQIDGIDLDNEEPGEIPGQNFVNLIRAVRSLMGRDFIITYPAFLSYRDQFLAQVKNELTLVCTMAYWNNVDEAIQLAQNYADLVGSEKVCIGVKPGQFGYNQSTPVAAVPILAAYTPADGPKGGMMLYSLSLDIAPVTGLSRFAWLQMVHENMPSAAFQHRKKT